MSSLRTSAPFAVKKFKRRDRKANAALRRETNGILIIDIDPINWIE
jgi:hypothetical protein